ncbi:Uncharacterised protein [Klebsiella michiganensis]|uniref:Uncharacterized protein n=2 Tax=Klebsiella michiganensis TaxID=1134687 RepID=A0A7H4LWK9_9ENTR|nr:Uncharacterised protein [Klebsiella michiganensis]STV76686.1 Uncharacterised protein [Klebsiella michiganensis]
MSCGYQGYEFGAHYPDSLCCDGYLWDCDAYEDGMLTNGGDIPCPVCNRKQWLAFYRDHIIECGMMQSERKRGPKTVKYGGFPEPVRVMQRLCAPSVAGCVAVGIRDVSSMRKRTRWWYEQITKRTLHQTVGSRI